MQTMPTMVPQTETPDESAAMRERREQAIKRIKAKNDFKVHLIVYLTINTMLVALWAGLAITAQVVTSSPTGAWFPWPLFPILGWGAGLAAHGYRVYFGDRYTEEQIQREMSKLPYDGRIGRREEV